MKSLTVLPLIVCWISVLQLPSTGGRTMRSGYYFLDDASGERDVISGDGAIQTDDEASGYSDYSGDDDEGSPADDFLPRDNFTGVSDVNQPGTSNGTTVENGNTALGDTDSSSASQSFTNTPMFIYTVSGAAALILSITIIVIIIIACRRSNKSAEPANASTSKMPASCRSVMGDPVDPPSFYQPRPVNGIVTSQPIVDMPSAPDYYDTIDEAKYRPVDPQLPKYSSIVDSYMIPYGASSIDRLRQQPAPTQFQQPYGSSYNRMNISSISYNMPSGRLNGNAYA